MRGPSKPAQIRVPGLQAPTDGYVFPCWGNEPASYLLRGLEYLRSKTEVVMPVLAAKHVRVAWHVQLTCDLKESHSPCWFKAKQDYIVFCGPFNSVLRQQETIQTMRKLPLYSDYKVGVGSVLGWTACRPRALSSCLWHQSREQCQEKPFKTVGPQFS